jgi:hypothetical protein
MRVYGLSALQTRTYNFIATHPNCTMKSIIEYVYADDPNGGPVSAVSAIHVQIHRINKRMVGKRIKAKIRASSSGRGATYRLLNLTEQPGKIIA